jgi:hypothetical protein
MNLSGDLCRVYVGYQLAAVIEGWRLTSLPITALGTPISSAGSGTIKKIDRFWITQRPITISVWMGSTWWTWKTANVDTTESPRVGGHIDILVKGIPEVTRTI